MPDTLPPSTDQLLRMTAELAAAYASNHQLAPSQLPETIKAIHGSLASLTAERAEATAEPSIPAVPVRRSITPDYLVCLEDGKRQKTLKRHLRTAHDLSPADYRKRWGLPAEYPMVAPNYAAQRSAMAKKIGLGRGIHKPKRPATARTRPARIAAAMRRRRTKRAR